MFSSSGNEKLIEKISSGLFSTLMSFNDFSSTSAPVLCTLKEKKDLISTSASDDLAELIRVKLENRIKNHLINTKSTQSTQITQQRPLLILLNRSIDLSSPLKHSSAYNALVDDILGINMNCIKISAKSYDIDRRDWLWRDNSCKPFPCVAECVENSLKSYKNDYDKIVQTTPGITEEMMNTTNNSAGSTSVGNKSDTTNALSPEQLKIAINVLPELTERKRLIDSHLQISTKLLEEIKSRDLGNLFHLEEEMSQLNQQTLLAALSNQKLGNPRDKLRLLIMFYLYNCEKSGGGVGGGNNLKSFCLETVGKIQNLSEIDLKAFKFVVNGSDNENSKRGDHSITKEKDKDDIKSDVTATGSNNNTNDANNGDFFSKLSLGNLVSSMKNIKSLLPSSAVSDSKVTKIIDMAYAQATTGSTTSSSYSHYQQQHGSSSLMSSFMSQSTASSPVNSPTHGISINLSDPKPSKSSQQQQSTSTYSIDHVIVLFVGGLTYSEYDNLLEHFGKNRALQNVSFTIGTTEMLNANTFIDQMAKKYNEW